MLLEAQGLNFIPWIPFGIELAVPTGFASVLKGLPAWEAPLGKINAGRWRWVDGLIELKRESWSVVSGILNGEVIGVAFGWYKHSSN